MDAFLAARERRAYRMAWFATGSRDDALEIVQDAMLKLVSRYADRDESDWGPLFQRILQSTIRDWYRRIKVRNKLRSWLGGGEDETDAMDRFAAREDQQPDSVNEEAEAMRQLDTALRELPVRQQQAFLLRNWEGLDVAATAAAMGCSQGSVKTHLSRANKQLRAALEEYR